MQSSSSSSSVCNIVTEVNAPVQRSRMDTKKPAPKRPNQTFHKCSTIDIWLFLLVWKELAGAHQPFTQMFTIRLNQYARRSRQSPSRARVVSAGSCTTRTYILYPDTLLYLPFPYSVSPIAGFPPTIPALDQLLIRHPLFRYECRYQI